MHRVPTGRVPKQLPSVWFLGFGLWWAVWFANGVNGSTWLPLLQQEPALAQLQRSVIYALLSLAFLSLVLVRRRIAPLHERRFLLVGAASVATGGIVLLYLAGTESVGTIGLFVGALLESVAAAPLVLAWGELYGTIGARGAGISICGSLLIGGALYLIVSTVGPVAPLPTVAMLACCPALSLLSLFKGWKHSDARALDKTVQRAPFRMPKAVLLGMFTYGVVFGLMLNLTASHADLGLGGTSLSNTLSLGFVAFFVLLSLLSSNALNYCSMYRPVLPLVAVGFMLLPILGNDRSAVASAIVFAGYACARIFATAVYSDIIYRVPAPALGVAGWGALADYGGVAVGSLLYTILLNRITLDAPQLYVISLLVVGLLILTSTFLLNETRLATLWGLLRQPASELPEAEIIEERCAEMAASYGLTPREREIVVLLAKGESTADIQKELCLSESTVRTYAKRIHSKLQVRSQPELIRKIVFHIEDQNHLDLPRGV